VALAPGPLLVVSPHLDDAVLSVGGLVAARAVEAPVVVLTVFAGPAPPGAPSDFARELHEAWGLGDDPVPGRRAEDVRALGVLGAWAVHLDLPDAIYRRDPAPDPAGGGGGGDGALRYPDWAHVAAGRLAPGDERDDLVGTVAGLLARAVARHRPAAVLGPLASGGHVDHLVARRACERWARSGGGPGQARLIWYEDLPYTARTGRPEPALVAGAAPHVVALGDGAFRRKLDAVRAYRSQLAVVFGPDLAGPGAPPAAADAVLTAHARRVAGAANGLAERLWLPTAPVDAPRRRGPAPTPHRTVRGFPEAP
jgi:LmbE family N-acetylglucosaminyl deacetylase